MTKEEKRQRELSYYDKNREYVKAREKRYKDKLRQDVLNLYGNKCACCGETVVFFLQLDHVNNNGGSHRRDKKGKRRDNRIAYIDAIKNPHLYQLLCANCNYGKQLNGGNCPHVDDFYDFLYG
jgi:hypothetical protein